MFNISQDEVLRRIDLHKVFLNTDGAHGALLHFRDVDLSHISFDGANLTRAKFEGCLLNETDFKRCEMRDTKFVCCYGRRTHFEALRGDSIILKECMIHFSNWSSTTTEKIVFSDSVMQFTWFGDCQFKNLVVEGTCSFVGSNEIPIQTAEYIKHKEIHLVTANGYDKWYYVVDGMRCPYHGFDEWVRKNINPDHVLFSIMKDVAIHLASTAHK